MAARSVTLALTGASGMPYGLRVLECLIRAGASVGLVYSPAAQIVAKQECDLVFPAQPREATRYFSERYGAKRGQLVVYGRDDWMAPIASGSAPADAMAVCPCTMGTLGAIACGLADNLIERAADVMLKERRPLVLVPRETPFSTLHLRNLLQLSELGVRIVPAMPAFYFRPQSMEDLVEFIVDRAIQAAGLPLPVRHPWLGADEGGAS